MRRDDGRVLADVQERSYARASPGLLESYPKCLAMNAEELVAFLTGRRYAVLATTRPDGRPQAAPIAFTIWGGAFWAASVEGARLRNLRSRPNASIVVMEGEDTSHRAVIAEGAVRLHEARKAEIIPEELRDLWVRRHGDNPTWASALIELRPQRLFSYHATKRPERSI